MNHFPIARSVLAADALPDVLQTAYGLRVARCRLIKAVLLDSYGSLGIQGVDSIYGVRQKTPTP
jgi:hypothetical protein